MIRKLLTGIALALASGIISPAHSQEVALKTNTIADGLLNVNAGIEVGLAPRWTFDLTGEFNGWKLSHGRRWKHWYAMPEARYWFCEKFGGHFLAVHAMGGQYNIGGFDGHWNLLGTDARKLRDNRYQGWYAGAGIGYGYAWMLSRHINLEAEIGIGYAYTRYSSYPCAECGTKIDNNKPHNYFGPTKAALNFVYVF
ncbi:MAG: DUF3575 domain-containing protein [Paramuribaculum sp.]|nr:DUF3575 domain-containing protein [Paramuribaculum sp.]